MKVNGSIFVRVHCTGQNESKMGIASKFVHIAHFSTQTQKTSYHYPASCSVTTHRTPHSAKGRFNNQQEPEQESQHVTSCGSNYHTENYPYELKY